MLSVYIDIQILFNMYSNRRKTYRRKRRPTRRFTKKPMTVGRVKRIISAELKLSLVGNDFIVISIASPMIISLTNGIVQGDTNMQRTGNWLQPITYHGYVTVRGVNNSPQISNNVRCGIIRWKNDESMDPALVNKIVQDPASPGASFKFTNKGAFTVLWSRFFNIVHSDQNPQFLKTYRWKVSLGRGQKVLYDAATPKKYQLFFFAFSDSTVDVESPSLAIDSTLRWTDS